VCGSSDENSDISEEKIPKKILVADSQIFKAMDQNMIIFTVHLEYKPYFP
jgi:hypothetical protein